MISKELKCKKCKKVLLIVICSGMDGILSINCGECNSKNVVLLTPVKEDGDLFIFGYDKIIYTELYERKN